MRQVAFITLTELQPGHRPAEEAADSDVTQETLPSFRCPFVTRPRPRAPQNSRSLPHLGALISPGPRLLSCVITLPPPRLSFLYLTSLSSYRCSPLLICPHDSGTSDPLNRFTLPILKVCLGPMISQSLFARLSPPGYDSPGLPSTSSLPSVPFLSSPPRRITLDIYSTAIRLGRDENRFSLQQLLLSG